MTKSRDLGSAQCDVCGIEFTRRAANHRLCGDIACHRRAKRDRQRKDKPDDWPVYRSYKAIRRDEHGKECTQCHQYQPWDQFYRVAKNSDGHGSWCKLCVRKSSSLRYLRAVSTPQDREELRIQRQAYKFGITVDEVRRLEAVTHCELCGDELGIGSGKRAIDHCHQTGKVRGVLCPPCNTALGRLGDTVEGLERAIEYLLRRRDVLREASDAM